MYFLLKILIWTVALNACFNIFSTWLTACGFVNQTNKILVSAVITNFIFSIFCIPIWESVGGAYALLSAFVVQSLGFLLLFMKFKNFELEISIFVKSLTVLFLGVFFLFILKSLQIHWIMNTIICVIFIAMGLLKLKLIQKNF